MSVVDWSLWRVLLVSTGWVVIAIVAFGWYTTQLLKSTAASDPAGGAIAAVSTSL